MRSQTEMTSRYKLAYDTVWERIATLSQIVAEDYPEPEAPDFEPTRYQIDMLNGLAGSLWALVALHEE